MRNWLRIFALCVPAACCTAPERLVDWGDGVGLRIERPTTGASIGNYTAIYGGDFSPTPLWSDLDHKSFGFNHVVGDKDWPDCSDFVAADLLESVTDRDGIPATVLRMQVKKYPLVKVEDEDGELGESDPDEVGCGDSELKYCYLNQINLVEAQPTGGEARRPGEMVTTTSGTHVFVEPVFYQSEWIRFSPNTLERAQAVGETGRRFWQMFWELKAADYRITVAILLNDAEDGLIVRAKGDSTVDKDTGSEPPYFIVESDVEVLLDDWNHFELYMDRTQGRRSRFIVHMNGEEVCDLTQKLPLPRVSPPIPTVFYANVYSNTHVLGDESLHPHYILIDDLELLEAPPCGSALVP